MSWIVDWLVDHSPVRSGTENERHAEWGKWATLYLNYKEAVEVFYPPRSERFIIALAQELKIRRATFDRYLCAICWQGLHPNDNSFPLKKRRGFLARYQEHRQLVQTQCSLHKQQRKQLAKLEVLLIYDYTRFHETAEVKVHDLGVVMITPDKVSYFDFFADAKHDYHYTAMVMTHFFATEETIQQATHIHIWNDGALRTKENLHCFSLLGLKYNVPIEIFIFAPYHGHSMADAHFGVGKKKLRRAFGGGKIATLEDIQNQFVGMHNTQTFIFGSIPKQTYKVKPLKSGIQKFFAFSFPHPRQVLCWQKYQEGSPVIQDLCVQ